MFILPFVADLDLKFRKHFASMFVVAFLWGVWRLVYFDPVTNNDIPGIAYLIQPFMMAGFAGIVFLVRKFLVCRFSSKRA